MLPQEILENLDLSSVERRLIDRYSWDSTDAKEAVRRYKNFLRLLLKYPDQILAPAPDMDEAWHNHILFTREYMRDCESLFGSYLHHSPALSSDPKEKKVMEDAQTRTSELYIKEFQEPYSLELNISSFW
jgi:hypothetical protein